MGNIILSFLQRDSVLDEYTFFDGSIYEEFQFLTEANLAKCMEEACKFWKSYESIHEILVQYNKINSQMIKTFENAKRLIRSKMGCLAADLKGFNNVLENSL